MKTNTYLFGEIDVDPAKVLEFPRGLANFEQQTRYMLIHEPGTGNDPVSYTLQSLDDPTLALQLIDPAALGFSYELALSDDEAALIGLANPKDAAVMLVIFKREDKATAGLGAGLRAPLIINTQTRKGLQKPLPRLHPNVVLSNLSSNA
ncbi:MAG: flagellar assembly protein FliW [Zoogloeaceae bacterium]|jgi:flagellar assembly factor FliW|nr:flagellar assembly protein FliW [Zoogloeaceae bacterium]